MLDETVMQPLKRRDHVSLIRIALLRGINVGRAKRIAMADLRGVVAGLGFTDVRTLLNSGNVVFGVPRAGQPRVAERIHDAIRDQLGVETRVTVIDCAELRTALDGNPLREVATNPSRFLIGVLADPADAAKLKPLREREWAPEAFALAGRFTYTWCPDGILASRAAVAVGTPIGDAITTRNLATMEKLAALAEA